MLRGMLKQGRRRAIEALERASRPLGGYWPRFSAALIGLLSLLIVAVCLSTYSTELSRFNSELLSGSKYVALINGLFNPFRTRHLLLKSGLPIYDISISKQEYAIIERTVEQAKKQGWMNDELKVWARAKFFHNGQKYNVKIRARGDLPSHWMKPKKSWRIKFGNRKLEQDGKIVEEPNFFEGKHQINLIVPADRRYVLSHFVNDIMRDYGLVVPRDRFVILRINGAVQGLYYEVEHFDNSLLASNRRPETAVYGQSDRAMHFEQYTKLGTPIASDARYDVGSVRQMVDTESTLGLRAMEVLLEHSRNPTPANFRRARAVLDWEKYLRFRIMTTLCNTNHVRFGSDNLRLYFDQSRGLLEPVPWDLHVTRLPKEPGTIDFWNNHGPDELQRATLMDPELRLERNRMLWDLVGDGGKGLVERFDRIHDRIRPLAWADVLTTPIQGHKMDLLRNDLVYNVDRVHKVLNLSSANVTFRLEASDRAAVEVAATNFSGIGLQALQISDPGIIEGNYMLYEDANDNGELDADDPRLESTASEDGTIRFALERNIFPQVRYDSDFIEGRYWEFFDTLAGRSRYFVVGRLAAEERDPLVWTAPDVKVTAVNAVTQAKVLSAMVGRVDPLPSDGIAITAYDATYPYDIEAPERSLAEFLTSHPQFSASEEYPGGAELQGAVTLADSVIVPKTVPLVLRPGTDLTLAPGISVLAYGGLIASGAPDQRISIHGDGSGKPWGVFAVVRPPREVVVKHIDVRDGNQGYVNGILFTGGFAVHDGDLSIEHCRFTAMQSEDAINLKNGHITMTDCLIADTESDGMDLDFVTGEVRSSAFMRIKGDGLDLSGSEVLVVGNRFENTGDKGISVGEDSHPTIVNNLIRGCQIGLATKDLSRPKVAHTTFVENVLAIEAKRKKPFFGGGGGEFVNNVFYGNGTLLSEDYFSRGQVSFKSSVVDRDATACAGCKAVPIHFQAPDTGDFRLAAQADALKGVAIAQVAWEGVDSSTTGQRVSQPGIFSLPANPTLQ